MADAVYFQKTDTHATLTTWVYCAMWQLYAADHEGLFGYPWWPSTPGHHLTALGDPGKFAEKPNMWDWYFVQPRVEGPPPPRAKTWWWENCPECGKHCLMGQPLEFIKGYYQSNLRYSREVEARGQALATKYGVDFSRTVGVSWRGTDCVTDGRPRMPIETYFPWIDLFLARDPDMRIMCTAEEQTVLAPLIQRYAGRAFVVDELFSAAFGAKHNPEWFNPTSGFERGLVPALMVWLLSKCRAYVKNRSSSGGVASWMSTGDIVCLAHPENLGYNFDLSKAEYKGQLYPIGAPPAQP